MPLIHNSNDGRLITDNLNARANISWFYPHICSFQDQITDKGEFFSFLETPPSEAPLPILLYVHIPFCHNFCAYCGCFKEKYGDFTEDEMDLFVDCLIKEIEVKSQKARLRGAKVKYVSFGGGTPSILRNELYFKLFEAFHRFFDMSECEGAVLEGNVMSLAEAEKVEALKAAGVTRLSFGVQSFNAKIRKALAVIADPDEVSRLAERIHANGMPFAIDLIYNLPEQTMEILESDLDSAYAIGSDYIHTYLFNQYPSTHLDSRIKDEKYEVLPTKDNEIDMYRLIYEKHMKAGYRNQMFINFFSNNLKPHLVSMELQLGWNRVRAANVVGIGPGAFSYIDGHNFKNYRNVRQYVQDIRDGQYPSDIGNYSSLDELRHRLMVYFPIFTRVAAADIPEGLGFQELMGRLVEEGFVTFDGTEYRLTLEGMIWAGNIGQLFYSQSQREKKTKSYYYCVKHDANPFNTDGMNVDKKRKRKVALTVEF